MSIDYEGWCRRIDLDFRSKYPYFTTTIYKIEKNNFLIKVNQDTENKEQLVHIFDDSIRYLTAPVHLTWEEPHKYESTIANISDNQIPSNFEGLPFTTEQIYNHLACAFPTIEVSSIKEDFDRNIFILTLKGEPSSDQILNLTEKLKLLKPLMNFEVTTGGVTEAKGGPIGEVFFIGPASAAKSMNCVFLERDENLWFEKLEDIYEGKYKKNDLYFIESKKTSCLANFSKFKNCNLRSLILLYDIVYCVLPLKENMSSFLREQRITKDDILHLISKGRIKILNLQPESRLDYGFINEAYQENNNAVVSRRALAALCAIDLVSINSSYVLSDPAIDHLIHPFIMEVSKATGQNADQIANYLLWPKQALRSSFNTLNEAGPMGVARYGVNKPISNSLPSEFKEKLEFEFVVNSDQIHLAHALDATYFPFYTEGEDYTDHPFALAMGNTLNFYKNSTYNTINDFNILTTTKEQGNPTLDLISTFQVNDFISIQEYESEISSSVLRQGMASLFSELSSLSTEDRSLRVTQYNKDLAAALSTKKKTQHALDLGIDTAGCFIPFLSTIIKYSDMAKNKIIEKMPAIRQVTEHIQLKSLPKSNDKKNISILSQVNRVAKLSKPQ
ncbi:hypothetical protein [Pseudomonas sp. MWU16-30322]|uniref:hypothetical protein n=1 Tax=Pseudomonas sp. MWU16-30322 TaxID=2878092 RepID=UPI001CF9F003|nr:hypothetical protein [Pseudomonas sp. MWU16-30322]